MTLRSTGLVAACFASLLLSCAGTAFETAKRSVALKNPDFEIDSGPTCARYWACAAHSDWNSFRYVLDSSVKVSGEKSLLIERVKQEPWATVTQVVTAGGLRGARLRFSLAVRVEGATGEGGGVFLTIENLSGRVIAHEQRLVKGTHDWQRLELAFDIPRETHVFNVGATLEGDGRLWIDDARLDVLREPAS